MRMACGVLEVHFSKTLQELWYSKAVADLEGAQGPPPPFSPKVYHLMLVKLKIWDPKYLIFTQALEELESFITMIGHRFPKFYNALLYATFQKSDFWQQKSRMRYKVVSV
jgi:hypothetical protein